MAERRVVLHQQLEVSGAGDDAEQQLCQPHQRGRRVLARAHLRQQARHQLIEHVAAARADGALVDVMAEIGDGAQHLSAPLFVQVRRQRRQLVFLQRVLPQAVIVLVVGIFADIRAIVADQIVEHRPHRLHVHLQRRHQRRPIRQPHAAGQPRLVERILRQRLGLLIADRLQQILQPPQEQVGGAQRPHLLGLQQPQLTHRLQRRQQRTPLQRRLTAAADQLKYLGDEFDFANAACAQFDVVLQAAPPHFTGDHALHVAQRLDDAEIDIATEHERPQRFAQLLAVGVFRTAHQARLHHRIALPVAPLLLIVVFQRREAHHQWAAVAERPQPHIDTIDEAVDGLLIQRLDQPLAQAGEELGIVQLAPPALGLAVFRVGEDQIDIRREIQLATAQLAHAEDQQRLRLAGGVARRAPLAATGLVQPVARADDQRLCQPAQLQQRFFGRTQPLRLRPGNAHQRFTAKQTQRAHQLRLIAHLFQLVLQPGGIVLPLAGGRRLFAQRRQPSRLGEQCVADEVARRQHPLLLLAKGAVRAVNFLKTLHNLLCLSL